MKYDWRILPYWIRWIITNPDKRVYGSFKKPIYTKKGWIKARGDQLQELNIEPFSGNWKESREKKPT